MEEQGLLKFAVEDAQGQLSEQIEVSLKYWEGRASFNEWEQPHPYF